MWHQESDRAAYGLSCLQLRSIFCCFGTKLFVKKRKWGEILIDPLIVLRHLGSVCLYFTLYLMNDAVFGILAEQLIRLCDFVFRVVEIVSIIRLAVVTKYYLKEQVSCVMLQSVLCVWLIRRSPRCSKPR